MKEPHSKQWSHPQSCTQNFDCSKVSRGKILHTHNATIAVTKSGLSANTIIYPAHYRPKDERPAHGPASQVSVVEAPMSMCGLLVECSRISLSRSFLAKTLVLHWQKQKTYDPTPGSSFRQTICRIADIQLACVVI